MKPEALRMQNAEYLCSTSTEWHKRQSGTRQLYSGPWLMGALVYNGAILPIPGIKTRSSNYKNFM